MNSISFDLGIQGPVQTGSLQERLASIADDLILSLPPPEQICAAERRRMIARYCVVLEGNFIYWMTGAYLSAKTEEARFIIRDNLIEEVRDCHPNMLRRFALAAGSNPDDLDATAVCSELTKVRLFVASLSSVPTITMMAFFEEFIRKFMPYLAELARREGSEEFEYTTVHSICDLLHSQELLRALEAEMVVDMQVPGQAEHALEGVHLLRALIAKIVGCDAARYDQTSRPDERVLSHWMENSELAASFPGARGEGVNEAN